MPQLSSRECQDAEPAHLRANVTRLSNLPSDPEYALVAFAPWFSAKCMLEYFAAARTPSVRAMIVYLPGQNNSMPPLMNDRAWYLDDGGGWKVNNTFPTYAISSTSGEIIAEELSLYSGNVTDAPSNSKFPAAVSSSDYVRLWASIDVQDSNRLPSLWVFLVIVVGLLVLVIGSTSLTMNLVQRRRRNSLRQRVVNGEVNLEALGIKRVVVPRTFLDTLPLYAYQSNVAPTQNPEKTVGKELTQTQNLPSPTIDAETEAKSNPLSRHASAPDAAPADAASTGFSQSTCAICLDDFKPTEGQVRELPCHHIFHSDCIDPFLLKNSSLCPLCKQSVLPAGYCPTTITNVMVRRERLIRRMAERNAANRANTAGTVPESRQAGVPGSLGVRTGVALGARRIFSAPTARSQRPSDIEMANNSSTASAPHPEANPTSPPATATSQTPGERASTVECNNSPPTRAQRGGEWARQRALALLGNRDVPGPADDEENSGPRWRRVLRKLFPGFR